MAFSSPGGFSARLFLSLCSSVYSLAQGREGDKAGEEKQANVWAEERLARQFSEASAVHSAGVPNPFRAIAGSAGWSSAAHSLSVPCQAGRAADSLYISRMFAL